MAAAKKTTSTKKKTADTAVKNTELVAEETGYYVFKSSDGTGYVRYLYKGNSFLPVESEFIGFVESLEEACSLACVEFMPSASYQFSKKTKEEFEERHDRIFDSVISIDNAALKVAFDLHWVKAKQAYKIKNFQSIDDYARFYFGYEKTSCYSLIAVVDRFAKRDKDGNILEEIDDAYSAYSSSKLALMVNLTDDQINKILKPSMSVRDIKKIVKSLENNALPDNSKDSGDKKDGVGEETKPPDQSGTDTGKDTIVDSKEIIRNTLFTFKGAKDYGKKFNADKVIDQVSSILKDHPDALIEISYTLP